jgi:hypothetical protein
VAIRASRWPWRRRYVAMDDPRHAREPEYRTPPDHAGLWCRTGADAQGRRHGAGRDVAERMRDEGGASSSTSLPTRTIRRHITKVLARRSGVRQVAPSPTLSAAWERPAPSWACPLPEGEEPRTSASLAASPKGLADSRHPQMAGGLPAEDLRQGPGGSAGVCRPGRCRGNDPAPGPEGGHLCRDFLGRRAGMWLCVWPSRSRMP